MRSRKNNSPFLPWWVLAAMVALVISIGLIWSVRLMELIEEKLSGSVHRPRQGGK